LGEVLLRGEMGGEVTYLGELVVRGDVITRGEPTPPLGDVRPRGDDSGDTTEGVGNKNGSRSIDVSHSDVSLNVD
jgi:hypothetical protein